MELSWGSLLSTIWHRHPWGNVKELHRTRKRWSKRTLPEIPWNVARFWCEDVRVKFERFWWCSTAKRYSVVFPLKDFFHFHPYILEKMNLIWLLYFFFRWVATVAITHQPGKIELPRDLFWLHFWCLRWWWWSRSGACCRDSQCFLVPVKRITKTPADKTSGSLYDINSGTALKKHPGMNPGSLFEQECLLMFPMCLFLFPRIRPFFWANKWCGDAFFSKKTSSRIQPLQEIRV